MNHQVESPFPATMGNGQRVKDELCTCGHLRSDHLDTAAYGHGQCSWPLCSCVKFTWKEFVEESVKVRELKK